MISASGKTESHTNPDHGPSQKESSRKLYTVLAVAIVSITVVAGISYWVLTQSPTKTFVMQGMSVTFWGNASSSFVSAGNCTNECGEAPVGGSITLHRWNVELSVPFNCVGENLSQYSLTSIVGARTGAFQVTNVTIEYVGVPEGTLPALLPYWNSTAPGPSSVCLGDVVPIVTFKVVNQGPTIQPLSLNVSVSG